MPAQKKAPGTRARRNVAATAATLPAKPTRTRIPKLPERDDGIPWHQWVTAWWRDIWKSPMSAEYHPTDFHQLLLLASVYHDFYTSPPGMRRLAAATEIRLQRASFGMTPYDRRRLEWVIGAVEDGQDRRARRKAGPAAPEPPAPSADNDPRRALRAV